MFGFFFSSLQALKPPSTNLYVPGGAELQGDFQLDVDVSGVVFSHHPLFSREHVLGTHLTQLYDHYLTRQHHHLTGHLTDKVNKVTKLPWLFYDPVLNNVYGVILDVVQLNGLRKAMQNMLGSHSLTEAMQQRITDYSLEIRSVPQISSILRLLITRLMLQSCDFFSPLKSQEHQAIARQ